VFRKRAAIGDVDESEPRGAQGLSAPHVTSVIEMRVCFFDNMYVTGGSHVTVT
jgi:hypothetical protein